MAESQSDNAVPHHRFAPSPKVTGYHSPIEQATLNKLMQRSDFRRWLQPGLRLGFCFVTVALAYAAYFQNSMENAFVTKLRLPGALAIANALDVLLDWLPGRIGEFGDDIEKQ